MKIEAGKRYVRRDGENSGVVTNNTHAFYPFIARGMVYTSCGHFLGDRLDHSLDLISEYIEPAAGLASRHGGPMAGC